MLDVAQFVLQNDLFVAGGLAYVLSLPFFEPYWNPVVSSKPLPEQSQIPPRPEAAVTQTVTVLPEPVTVSPTQTIYDTVIKNITSISTVVHQQVVTKRRCLPTNPDAPRATSVTFSENWTQPRQTCARCVPCTPLPSTKSASTKPVARIISTSPSPSPAVCDAWVLLSSFIFVLGAIFLIFRLDLVSKRVAKAECRTKKISLALEAEKKCHQYWRTQAHNYLAELETNQHETQELLEGIAKRNDMLKILGVFKNDNEIVDEENLEYMVRERKAYLGVDANRFRRMEAENAAQVKQTKELEAEIARTKDQIKTLRSEILSEDAKRKFQQSLDDKQHEITYWRDAFLRNKADTTLEESQRLCEQKEAELQPLRLLPAKIDELQQALSDATKQIETLEQEKKEQGIANRRRWNKEKEYLSKEHAKAIKALKDDLKKVKEPSASPIDNENAAANKQLLLSLKEENAELLMDGMHLQQEVFTANKTVAEVLEELYNAKQECEVLKAALHEQQNMHTAQNQQLLADFNVERNAIVMGSTQLVQQQQILNQDGNELVHSLNYIQEDRDDVSEEHGKLNLAYSKLERLYEATNEHYMNVKEQQTAHYMQEMNMQIQLTDAYQQITEVGNALEDLKDDRADLADVIVDAGTRFEAANGKYMDLKADQNQLGMEAMNVRMQLHTLNETVAVMVQDAENSEAVTWSETSNEESIAGSYGDFMDRSNGDLMVRSDGNIIERRDDNILDMRNGDIMERSSSDIMDRSDDLMEGSDGDLIVRSDGNVIERMYDDGMES